MNFFGKGIGNPYFVTRFLPSGRTQNLSGEENRLTKSGVSVITFKPGFVDTHMTAHIKKTANFADSKTVGGKIYQTMKRP